MAQVLATTLVVASLYALLGAGYVLVYRASRVLNLAQGDLLTLGGYFLFAVAAAGGTSPLVAIPAAAVLGAAAGFLIYHLLMRPMAGHPVFAAVLVTVTLGILLRAAIVLVFTDRIRHPLPMLGLANPPRPLPGGAVVSTVDLLTVATAGALFLGLFLFSRRSPLGIQMRAAGERALLASQRGIDFHLVFALSWALAAFAGALAGILYASNVRLEPSLDVLGLKAFAVALVGGLDSLGGVIPAALLVALVEVLSVRYGNPLLSDVSPFLCLLAMLLVRPWGLFGTREELERV
jgi:branched-chain amino acid transport system permease protein